MFVPELLVWIYAGADGKFSKKCEDLRFEVQLKNQFGVAIYNQSMVQVEDNSEIKPGNLVCQIKVGEDDVRKAISKYPPMLNEEYYNH